MASLNFVRLVLRLLDRRIDARIQADRSRRNAEYWNALTPYGRKMHFGATEEEAAHDRRAA